MALPSVTWASTCEPRAAASGILISQPGKEKEARDTYTPIGKPRVNQAHTMSSQIP